MASYVAGPTAGRLLGAMGAEVIKVEPPGAGDEVRRWHTHGAEQSLLWRSLGSNKKSVTIDVHQPEGVRLVLDLLAKSDVLIEGFRPGTMERLGFGLDVLESANPELIFVRISGFGQTGPYRDLAGFGSTAEAIGGVRHLTGYPDRPSTRIGVSLGDSLAGVYAVVGVLNVLVGRARDEQRGSGTGGRRGVTVVDVALYEAVLSLLDSVVADYDVFGEVRQRTGSALPGVAPSNTYPTSDGRELVIGGNGDRVFRRLAAAMGSPELAEDPRFAGAAARAQHADELDRLIAAWTRRYTALELRAILDAAGVPAAPIYDAAQISADPHVKARCALDRMSVPMPDGVAESVGFPAPVPRTGEFPLVTRWVGPELGAHTEEVLRRVLDMSAQDMTALRERGVL
jgi:formyl-CoA transferase